MKKWSVANGKDGFFVHLEEAPAWAYAVEWLYTTLDRASFCTLCGTRLGEWVWKVPVGRPKYEVEEDDERYLTNSIGGKLYDLTNWALNTAHRHRTGFDAVKIDDELGKKLWGPMDTWLDK